MARWGSCDTKELKKFQEKLEKMSKANIQKFCEDISRELAARLLRKVIKRTPVGIYSSGKVGGTLRRGWTAKTEQEAKAGNNKGKDISSWVNQLPIKKIGNIFQIDVTNVVNYSSYVEFGHRTRNHKGWVEGQFMLTISEKEINAILPKFIERKLIEFLNEVL